MLRQFLLHISEFDCDVLIVDRGLAQVLAKRDFIFVGKNGYRW